MSDLERTWEAQKQSFREQIKELLERNEKLENLLLEIYVELDGRYDGAPDSTTEWMAFYLADIGVLVEKVKQERRQGWIDQLRVAFGEHEGAVGEVIDRIESEARYKERGR